MAALLGGLALACAAGAQGCRFGSYQVKVTATSLTPYFHSAAFDKDYHYFWAYHGRNPGNIRQLCAFDKRTGLAVVRHPIDELPLALAPGVAADTVWALHDDGSRSLWNLQGRVSVTAPDFSPTQPEDPQSPVLDRYFYDLDRSADGNEYVSWVDIQVDGRVVPRVRVSGPHVPTAVVELGDRTGWPEISYDSVTHKLVLLLGQHLEIRNPDLTPDSVAQLPDPGERTWTVDMASLGGRAIVARGAPREFPSTTVLVNTATGAVEDTRNAGLLMGAALEVDSAQGKVWGWFTGADDRALTKYTAWRYSLIEP